MTAPQRDKCATVASLPKRDEVSSKVTCEWKSRVHLRARSWEWAALWVKVNGAFASTFLRVSWLASEGQWYICKHVLERWSWLVSESQQYICKHVLKRWSWLASARAAVLLVDTSKVTQEQALQVWAWKIQKQQYRWRWRQVLERCCGGSSRGETDDLAYLRLLIYPRRLEEWQISWLSGSCMVIRVKSLWKSWWVFGTQEGGDTYHVIAGRMSKSCLVYKVILPVRPCSCKKCIKIMMRRLMLEDLLKGRKSEKCILVGHKKKRKMLRCLLQSCPES